METKTLLDQLITFDDDISSEGTKSLRIFATKDWW